MNQAEIEARSLPMEGAYNVRDLGGLPLKEGGRTQQGWFLRADGTFRLTEADLDRLMGMGLTLSVDLRSPAEVQRQPSRLEGRPDLRYVNLSMQDGVQSAQAQWELPASLFEMYRSLLDGAGAQFQRLFRLFAENQGLCLYHCTAGKDRTGVTTMLLLRLAGVPDEAIVEDYAATEQRIAPLLEEQNRILASAGIQVPAYILRSQPETMERTLAYLDSRFDGAEAYLLGCGLSQAELDLLRSRLRGQA